MLDRNPNATPLLLEVSGFTDGFVAAFPFPLLEGDSSNMTLDGVQPPAQARTLTLTLMDGVWPPFTG